MKPVLRNPYRIIEILVGASAREQERQIKRLRQFFEAEQELKNDFSFPVLGNLTRSIESITEATSKLHLDSDKMDAALFWFYRGNPITDEPAFEYLRDGDQQSAFEIWSKLVSTEIVTQRNCSAFQNLSNLLLNNTFNDNTVQENQLEQGISLKLKFLESEYVNDFKSLATDSTYKTSKNELQLSFLNHIQTEIDNYNVTINTSLFEILNKQEFSAKKDYFKSYAKRLIEPIEKKISDTKAKRKANNSTAVNAGKELFEQSIKKLVQLDLILGKTDLGYTSITDKVSEEVLNCGIDYFLYYRGSNVDPSGAAMDCFKKAKSIAFGSVAKQRSQENIENLQEWIDEKPKREKENRIKGDFNNLKELIDKYGNVSGTVSNAKQLLSLAFPHLNNIKVIIGNRDDLYLGLSTRIASDAQGMCVNEVNILQERFKNSYDQSAKLAAIRLLKEKVYAAWDVTVSIGKMDLKQDFRNHLVENQNTLSKSQNSTVKCQYWLK